MKNKILLGDCLDKLKELEDNSVDSIVTDPPYHLTSIVKRFGKKDSAPAQYGSDGVFQRASKGFMGKEWDGGDIAFRTEVWEECLRVLKPGGHILAFGGTRTYHRMTVAIEDAGFEVRDMIEWVYGCLSEDTEILTESGYKFFKDISKDEKICIYNKDNNSYSYERPEKWSSYKVENEDCYSIKSDDTDQIVSKNHRCLVERNGKLEFEFAENLREKEIVPLFEGNKVYNGDCLEVMKTLEDKSIDMVLTSPPYDNLRDYKGYTFNFEGIAQEIYRVLKDGGVCVWVVGDATIKGSETGTSFKQALYFKDIGFNLHDTMIYEKSGVPFPEFNRYYPAFEYMFVFSKGKPKTHNLIQDRKNIHFGATLDRLKHGRQSDGTLKQSSCYGKKRKIKEFGVRYNIWKYSNAPSNGSKDKIAYQHPATFPEKLAEDHILSWSNEGDTILDPMAGSGTTLKMAKKNNRNYIGIEIAPEYVDIINQRLQDKPKTTEATITKIKYSGIIFCPTVSTGAFVARRNGQVFITGNSGFPKSHNIGKAVDKLQGNEREEIGRNPNSRENCDKSNTLYESGTVGKTDILTKGTSEWEGWGTALKPAHEPICMARKPLSEKTVAENCLKWGTGGINIDGCRVGTDLIQSVGTLGKRKFQIGKNNPVKVIGKHQGRFPANLIHDGSDEVVELFPETGAGKYNKQTRKRKGFMLSGSEENIQEANAPDNYGDSGSASRFFKSIIYNPKASKAERNKGCEELEERDRKEEWGDKFGAVDRRLKTKNQSTGTFKNHHPTVKPIALMEYLIKMVTPKGGIVLDPFMGSGSTGVAAKKNGYDFIGIDMTPEYVEIAKARINAWEEENKLL